MTTVFQVFKVFMGLFISIFVLYFLINYSGIYASIQKDTMRAQVLRNFNKLAQDVYYAGIATDFEDFGRVEWGSLEVDTAPAAGLMTESLGKWAFKKPTLFTPAEEMVVSRATLDLGWWEFHMVEAMPPKRIIINILDQGENAWAVVRSLVGVMPSTLALENKVTFEFCNGEFLVADFCGSAHNIPCEKDYFAIELRNPTGVTFGKCTADIYRDAYLVTVSPDCSPLFASSGLCIQPPNNFGIGTAFLTGTDEPFIYKDGLDLAALLIGGNHTSIFGPAGKNLWAYKNERFREEINLSADMFKQTSFLLLRRINTQRAKLPRFSSTVQCMEHYQTLRDNMDAIRANLQNPNYYKNAGSLTQLILSLGGAKNTYNELVNLGCEYI